jgi:hypothetical protein
VGVSCEDKDGEKRVYRQEAAAEWAVGRLGGHTCRDDGLAEGPALDDLSLTTVRAAYVRAGRHACMVPAQGWGAHHGARRGFQEHAGWCVPSMC